MLRSFVILSAKASLVIMACFATASVFPVQFAYAQQSLKTESISGYGATWNITNGVVQFCNSVNCASPQNQPAPVPSDAELHQLPNGGLWIVTPDARYQWFCGLFPNCAQPTPPLTTLTSEQIKKGMKYQYQVNKAQNILDVNDPRSPRTTRCLYDPKCIP